VAFAGEHHREAAVTRKLTQMGLAPVDPDIRLVPTCTPCQGLLPMAQTRRSKTVELDEVVSEVVDVLGEDHRPDGEEWVKEITRSRRYASLDACISSPELDLVDCSNRNGMSQRARRVHRLNRSAGSRNLHSRT
jgi:hypothetical protein